MKKVFFILLFIFTSCGYQPLYNLNKGGGDLNIKFQEISLAGNINISKKISLSLPLELVKKEKSLNKLIIHSQKNINETSKNLKGQVDSYQTLIEVKLSILDHNNKLVEEKTSIKEFLYNTKDNKFEFKEYQTEIENNLISKIVEDLSISLNF